MRFVKVSYVLRFGYVHILARRTNRGIDMPAWLFFFIFNLYTPSLLCSYLLCLHFFIFKEFGCVVKLECGYGCGRIGFTGLMPGLSLHRVLGLVRSEFILDLSNILN